MRGLLLAAAILTAGATPAQWPMYQARADHNAVFDGSNAYSWHAKFHGKINGGLALAGSTLYVESFDKHVTAVDARTGRVLWSTRVPNVVMTTPIVAGGRVIVGTGTNQPLANSGANLMWGRPQHDWVIALDAGTGRTIWRYRTTGEDMPSPALINVRGVRAIVFANGDDHIRALAVSNGQVLWQRPVRGISTMSSAAVDRGRVFLIVGTGPNSQMHDRVLAIDPQRGAILWSAPYANADCSPTVAGGLVFAQGSSTDSGRPANAASANDVVAVDENTGKLRWRWYSGLGSFDSVGSNEEGIAGLASDGTLYQAIPATSEFAAFDAQSGRVRWKIHTAARVKMSAIIRGGRLYFGDTGSTLYTVDARDGRVLARQHFPSYFTVSSPVIAGHTLYIANNRTVYAIPLK